MADDGPTAVDAPAPRWSDAILALAQEAGAERIVTYGAAGDAPVPGALHVCADLLGQVGLLETSGVLGRLATLAPATFLAATIDLDFVPAGGQAGALLPIRTWRMLIELAGFEILDERGMPGAEPAADVPGEWLKRYWNDADLFAQANVAEPRRLLLCRRKPTRVSVRALVRKIDDLLDVAYLRAKRERFGDRLHRPLVLNIHQIQDYLNLRPMIELLDPGQTVPLIREHAEFDVLKRFAVASDLRRHGFSPRFYRRIEDLDWSEIAGKPMLSASESSITQGHALSRQLVEAATAASCPTFLVQHGIWSEAFPAGPVSFGSARVLTWGREHAESFAAPEDYGLGMAMPLGATPVDRFRVAGSPKFADMLAAGGKRSLGARLGFDESGFAGVTMIGTNLHWGRHKDTGTFTARIRELSRARREQLFIVKVHPAESFYRYETLRDRNVVVYDDVLALATGYHVSRMLRAVDRVASSLSSLLIDASILGLPVFQYETGNALRYRGIAPMPLADLPRMFSAAGEAAGRASAAMLAREYAEGDHGRFYDILCQEIDDARVAPEHVGDALGQLAAYGLIEQMATQQQPAMLRIEDIEALAASRLFDPEHYVRAVGDLEGMSPIEHYLTRGGWRGIDPRPAFASHWHATQYPDVAASGMLPVLHYIRIGARLGHDPHILFRDSWYRGRAGDIPPHLTPLGHYLDRGEAAGLSCHPFFDAGFYAASLTQPVAGSVLEHFLRYEDDVGGDPSPSFAIANYLRLSPDLDGAGINPLLHYLLAGASERRPRSDVQRL